MITIHTGDDTQKTEIELKDPAFKVLTFTPCKSNAMRHGPFVVDEEAGTVECKTCEKKLDPMHVLQIFIRQESWLRVRFKDNEEALQRIKKEVEQKNRVKCEHCRKLTSIKKRLPYGVGT